MPEFTWDHTHIKTYDVPGTAAWLQDKLGASSVQGTTASEAARRPGDRRHEADRHAGEAG